MTTKKKTASGKSASAGSINKQIAWNEINLAVEMLGEHFDEDVEKYFDGNRAAFEGIYSSALQSLLDDCYTKVERSNTRNDMEYMKSELDDFFDGMQDFDDFVSKAQMLMSRIKIGLGVVQKGF